MAEYLCIQTGRGIACGCSSSSRVDSIEAYSFKDAFERMRKFEWDKLDTYNMSYNMLHGDLEVVFVKVADKDCALFPRWMKELAATRLKERTEEAEEVERAEYERLKAKFGSE